MNKPIAAGEHRERMLRHCTIGEIAVGIGVLAAVSVLGTLEPA